MDLILSSAPPWSATQDEVHYFKGLTHPEEAPFETPPAAAPQDRGPSRRVLIRESRIFTARYWGPNTPPSTGWFHVFRLPHRRRSCLGSRGACSTGSDRR